MHFSNFQFRAGYVIAQAYASKENGSTHLNHKLPFWPKPHLGPSHFGPNTFLAQCSSVSRLRLVAVLCVWRVNCARALVGASCFVYRCRSCLWAVGRRNVGQPYVGCIHFIATRRWGAWSYSAHRCFARPSAETSNSGKPTVTTESIGQALGQPNGQTLGLLSKHTARAI